MIVVSPAANSLENGRSACTAMRKPDADEAAGTPAIDRDRAEQPELLADRGEDEVGRRVGDLLRVAEPEPGAGEPAGAEREHRLHDLEALAVRVADHGSIQVTTRSCTWPNSWYAMVAPPTNRTNPTSRYAARSVAM